MRHLQPIIEERERCIQVFGEDWPEKPVCRPPYEAIHEFMTAMRTIQDDMLMWLMDEARSKPRPLEEVVRRILALNFAAMNTTSNVRILTMLYLCDTAF